MCLSGVVVEVWTTDESLDKGKNVKFFESLYIINLVQHQNTEECGICINRKGIG